jgi:thymidylate synthase
MNNTDLEYQRLLRLILEKGKVKKNRTGTDTIGVFGAQARYDLSEGFPLLTTKKVHYPAIIHELLWFIKGDTNIKYLVDNGCNIWNGDAYRKYKTDIERVIFNGEKRQILSKDEFIFAIKNVPDFAKQHGDLGQGTYGQMWRAFPFIHYSNEGDQTISEFDKGTGIDYQYGRDQLGKAIEKLKSNPDDRRIIVSAWHPYWVDHCALPPCHCLFHFNTEELASDERWRYAEQNNISLNKENCSTVDSVLDKNNIPSRRLNCLLYQRSCDFGLGIPFNIASYSLLLAMVAKEVNMVAGEFIHTYGDLHIYKNHLEPLKEQLKREPYPLPNLWLNPEVKSIFDYKFADIRIENYQYHPAIKLEVSTG